jgi:alpha-N-arabinofuranosidase
VQKAVESAPWQVAPSISEQIYTMEDALLFAEMLMSLLRNSDRIKIACQSLLTNISACIMTERGGASWVQPIYYPFAWIARCGRGIVMDERSSGPSYSVDGFAQVPYVDHVTVYNPEKEELVLFLVNRMDEKTEISYEFQMYELGDILESLVLHHKDKKATNLHQHDHVVPEQISNSTIEDHFLTCELEPLSFQMIRVSAK